LSFIFANFIFSVIVLFYKPSFPDPLEIQMTAGCEVPSGKCSVGFLKKAYQGSDFLSFPNNPWLPSPKGGEAAQNACRLLNQYYGYKETVHRLFSDTCPCFLLGLLDVGKAHLQRQGQSCTLPSRIFLFKITPSQEKPSGKRG
jgi:CD1 antigen